MAAEKSWLLMTIETFWNCSRSVGVCHYEAVTALREEEAVEAVKAQTFDLAIVDLQLMQRDGIALMEELHLISPDLPVLILTAHGSIESAVEAMKRGAYGYVTKPFEFRDLLLQIERALENRRLASEITDCRVCWSTNTIF